MNCHPKNPPKFNLSPAKQIPLYSLQALNDIIITKADQDGAVVIWDAEGYIKEAYKQQEL